jgi:hypothetical protein
VSIPSQPCFPHLLCNVYHPTYYSDLDLFDHVFLDVSKCKPKQWKFILLFISLLPRLYLPIHTKARICRHKNYKVLYNTSSPINLSFIE